ncbi:MAG: glycoside hydrolase family 43 protein [Protaetiibacter sp.]
MTVPLYRNPIAGEGDFADPFVLRHDGRYYLYATNPDVRCWSSDDLVTWTLEGATIEPEEFPGLVPFAPEVVYADGAFFMYTSPSGHGHHVLRADAPTGPFRRVTGNVGHAIDGNVLIDDDGRWYFYWAGDEGIWGCEMPSPTEFGEPVLTGVHMNGWTEGPFVTRRGEGYIMTLTGNHYLSRGYRIDAAYSDDPLRGWRSGPLNPVLVSADGPTTGLGHSSSVRGPDLVSTYLVFHNINPDASRDLDIDRQVANDRTIQVLGPSTSAPVPAAPDAVWSGELSPAFGSTVTAELNLTAEQGADGYGIALETAAQEALEVRVDRVAQAVVGSRGGDEDARAALPAAFVHEALHCWRVVVADGELRLALDGRQQFAVPLDAPDGVRIRTVGAVGVGHCAATEATEAQSDRAAIVPVPGRFWATLSRDATELVREAPDAVYHSAALHPGARLGYRLHLQHDLEPIVHLTGVFAAGDELALGLDGAEPRAVRVHESGRVVRVDLPPATSADGGADAVRTLTVEVRAGHPVLTLLTVTDAAARGGALQLGPLTASGFEKRTVAAGVFDDVVIDAELSIDARPGGHGDLLLRASELSDGGEGDDMRLGIHFLRGYSVQLHADRVVLARHGYDERVLAEGALPTSLEQGARHRLVVRATGSRLAVELDGAPVLAFDDPLPELTGRIGIRAVDAELHVHELHVEPS